MVDEVTVILDSPGRRHINDPPPLFALSGDIKWDFARLRDLEKWIASVRGEMDRLRELEKVCLDLWKGGQRGLEDSFGCGGVMDALDPFFFGRKIDE